MTLDLSLLGLQLHLGSPELLPHLVVGGALLLVLGLHIVLDLRKSVLECFLHVDHLLLVDPVVGLGGRMGLGRLAGGSRRPGSRTPLIPPPAPCHPLICIAKYT